MVKIAVAPLAGAWIEIPVSVAVLAVDMSLPSRERGLKCINQDRHFLAVIVAPLAGAWIEMWRLEIIRPCIIGRSPRGSVD